MLGLHLRWLHYLDARWTKTALMPMFELDHRLAEPFWNGFLWHKVLPSRSIFTAIKPNFLQSIADVSKWAWSEGEASSLTQFLVAATFSGKGSQIYITRPEAREALQSTNDDGRVAALHQLQSMISKEKDWRSFGPTFFSEVWPTELRYQTQATSSVIAQLVVHTGMEFARAVHTVLPLLQPIPDADSILYSLMETEQAGGSSAMAIQHPVESVIFADRLIANQPSYLPYNLREFLRGTAEAELSLKQDLRWRRLNDLTIGH
jgi:hypothetical protein